MEVITVKMITQIKKLNRIRYIADVLIIIGVLIILGGATEVELAPADFICLGNLKALAFFILGSAIIAFAYMIIEACLELNGQIQKKFLQSYGPDAAKAMGMDFKEYE